MCAHFCKWIQQIESSLWIFHLYLFYFYLFHYVVSLLWNVCCCCLLFIWIYLLFDLLSTFEKFPQLWYKFLMISNSLFLIVSFFWTIPAEKSKENYHFLCNLNFFEFQYFFFLILYLCFFCFISVIFTYLILCFGIWIYLFLKITKML